MNLDAHGGPDPIEELLLTAYPNPERVGCPDRKTLEALGNLARDESDPAWNHIWHCSPCFAEFKVLRDERWAKQERARSLRKRQLFVAALLGVVAVVLLMVFLVSRQNSQRNTAREIATLTLNLYDVEILRGGTADTPVHLPPLPRKLDELRVILPRFAEPGRYSIAVLKSRENGSAIALASGTASSKRGKIELTVRLDLSAAPPGQYLLGTRLDDNQTTFYYPVTVI